MSKRQSEAEHALVDFLHHNGIGACHGSGVPPFFHSLMGRRHSPDIFVPAVDLYIEVKGEMTMCEMRKIEDVAQRPPHGVNYYLYQSDDWDWETRIEDWPCETLSAAESKYIQGCARLARCMHEFHHIPRASRSAKFPKKKSELEYRVVMQRQELLIASQNAAAAAAAAAVTLKRLQRYMAFHLTEFLWLPQTAVVAINAGGGSRRHCESKGLNEPSDEIVRVSPFGAFK